MLSLTEDREFLQDAGIMFIASIVAGICNYLYQIYMGRALGVEEYGIFGSLFALSYIIFVVSGTIQTSCARFVSKFVGEGKEGNISYLLHGLLKRMFIFGIIVFVLFILSSGLISSFLKIESVLPVVIVGGFLFLSILLPVNLGALQGLQKFKWLGSNSIINFSSKLLFGVLLVGMGFGVNGALSAIVIGSAIALMISFAPLKSFLFSDCKANPGFNFLELYKYSLPAMLATFCFAVPANVDVMIVKHFFSSHDAGLYTAASVLGKIVLFMPGAITAVMFPKVSEMNASGKSTREMLNKSLFYATVLSGSLAIGYWFFPSLVIKIPFGDAYLEAMPLVRFYGIAMLFFSLSVVFMRYSLAIHDIKYVYGFAFFTFLEIVLLANFHETMMEMILILMVINVLLFIFSCCYVWYKPRRLRNGE